MRDRVAEAYNATGAAWQSGPGRVYDRLAGALIDRCPAPLRGARVLDVGAGTGAATRAAQRRGASVVALDIAWAMLATDPSARPPAVVADSRHLPVASGSVDAAVAMFSLNHLPEPAQGLGELARVLRPGGGFVATAYAAEDGHPAKAAVDDAAGALGWREAPWYTQFRNEIVPLLATVERARRAAATAGLATDVEQVAVELADLGPRDLVEWRMGMAHLAPFVETLDERGRERLVADALTRLGQSPSPLVRAAIVITYRRP